MLLAMFSMYRPIKQLARLHNNLLQAQAASERVFELLETQSSISEPENPKPLKAAGADVTFEHVHFAYGEKTVIKDVNLTVKAGQLVAELDASTYNARVQQNEADLASTRAALELAQVNARRAEAEVTAPPVEAKAAEEQPAAE